ncbi:MAG: hypothetical protein ACPGVG_10685 [Mycobacterium sp.]
MRFWYLLVAPGLVLAGIAAAPVVAASDCTTVDNMTLCALGDEDGDLPTLPATGSGNPGYSYGPGKAYDHYYDDGYRWFTP